MIPACLNLNQHQRNTLSRWIEKYRKEHPCSEDSEDVTMASNIKFEVYTTGIGDVVHAIIGDQKYYLDDGLED